MVDHYTKYTVAHRPDCSFEVVFTNSDTKSQVKLLIPSKRSFRDPNKELKEPQVHDIAKEIAKVLGRHLEGKHN